MPESPKSRIFISVQWLLLGSITVLLTIILAVIFYWFYGFATQQASYHVMQDLTQMVQYTVLNVNTDDLVALAKEGEPNGFGVAWEQAGDDEAAKENALKQFPDRTNGFSDDPRYLKLLNWLETIHRIEPRAWPYLWFLDEEQGELVYVADLAVRYNPRKSTGFLEREEDTDPTTELSLSTDEQGNLESYTDDWGSWYSAWMPIVDSDGRIIGGIGVDFEAGDVDRAQKTIRDILLVIFTATYLVTFLTLFLIARTITRPIAALTRAADLVGEGDYDQDFATLYGGKYFQNEVGVLSRVFTAMVAKIERRVVTLQQQVQELRIEIDQAKRMRQVEEISSTEFFRELQIKARNMRRAWAQQFPPDENK